MKKTKFTACGRYLFAVLMACLAGPLAAQGSGAGDTAIEVVRQGIPHDALYALDMHGEWGLAVGAFGLMLETTDGGGSWKLLPPKTPLGLFGVTRAGDRVLVAGQQGTVMRRVGDGEWEMLDSGFSQRVLNIGLNDAGIAAVVGEFGFIAISTNGGSSWNEVVLDWEQYNDEGYEPHLYDAIVGNDGSILVAGEFGLILRTTDNGQTWEAVHTGDQSVFDLYIASDGSNSGFAVGQEGFVARTADGGLTWQDLSVDTNANLLGVWSGNSEVVITGIRELLRSSDDGASFSKTTDIQVVRHWFQGVDAGVAETASGGAGFLREQSVYTVGHRATIAKIVK